MAWWMTLICMAGCVMAADAEAVELDIAVKQAAVVMVDTSAAGLSESVADSIRSWGTRPFTDIQTPVTRLPVFTPRSDVDYKIRVMTPDPNIDYRIRAVGPGRSGLRDPGTPFLPYPNNPFKPYNWKIPDFRLFPRR